MKKKVSTGPSGRLSQQADNDEINTEELKSIYLSVLQNIQEEITTPEELLLLLQHAGRNPSKKTLEKYWGPKTDSYTFQQYCSIVKQEKTPNKRDLLKAFKKIDVNNDGFITHDELFKILTKRGERMTKAEVKSMMDDADCNGDGKLDYDEFCSMMANTIEECKNVHSKPITEKEAFGRKNTYTISKDNSRGVSSNREDSRTYSSSRQDSRGVSPIKEDSRGNSSLRQNSRGVSPIREDSRDYSSSRQDSRGVSPIRENFRGDNSFRQKEKLSEKPQAGRHKESIISKLANEKEKKNVEKIKVEKFTKEPSDLNRWKFHSLKGSFFKESDGTMDSHHYEIKITQPTTIWMTMKSVAPKYGKYSDDVLDVDMMLFLMDDKSKLVAFSNSIVEGRYCLQSNVDIGVYTLLTYTSGVKLQPEYSNSGKVNLVKGSEEETRLTKLSKDTLMEIFYRCDLDGNGYLSYDEFNIFQKKCSGEECDEEAWEVVKETFEVTPQYELTANGFLELNLMEARDPDGGQDELWVTLESMGYSNKLQLTMACPFQLEIFTKHGSNKITSLGVSDGGVQLLNALTEVVELISDKKTIKNKKDLFLNVAEFDNKIILAVENQSFSKVRVNIDCRGSENLLSKCGSTRNAEEIKPKSIKIIHELVADNKNKPTKLKYNESIV